MGIEDILMYDESLFQNINAFDPDYVPPNYNFRDTQMEAMAMSIRPAMREANRQARLFWDHLQQEKQQQSEKCSNW